MKFSIEATVLSKIVKILRDCQDVSISFIEQNLINYKTLR